MKNKNIPLNQLAALLTAALLGVASPALAQNLGISATGSPPDNSALLDVDATGMNPKKGVLIPRMTTAERNAIPSPANSLLIFNTDCNVFQVYNASTGKWYDLLQNDYGAPSITFANSVTFNYTGAVQSWTVPNGVCWIKIKAWGAGGGGGGADCGINTSNYRGGGGGYVEKLLKVTPGDVIQIYVGQGGVGASANPPSTGGSGGWGYSSGGAGGNGPSGTGGGGGGGGGSSAILHNGNVILVAAGGGGAGGANWVSACGNSLGYPGVGGAAGNNGGNGGGSCIGGTAGGSGSPNGQNGNPTGYGGGEKGGGGGGGGGYPGGAGGNNPGCTEGGAGGGGGLSYCAGSNCTITNGSGQNPGNAADPDRPAGIGVGGNGATGNGAAGSNGGNGFVKIYY
jgi:hypothetical protein